MPANGERRRQLRSWHRPKAVDGAAAAVHGIKASSMTIFTALPPISSHGVVESRSGAVVASEPLRFHSPLIKPDVRISRIRLSDQGEFTLSPTGSWVG